MRRLHAQRQAGIIYQISILHHSAGSNASISSIAARCERPVGRYKDYLPVRLLTPQPLLATASGDNFMPLLNKTTVMHSPKPAVAPVTKTIISLSSTLLCVNNIARDA